MNKGQEEEGPELLSAPPRPALDCSSGPLQWWGQSNNKEEMALNTDRRTVDLSAFPDLVVIYLGMRVNKLRGLKTLLRFGPKIAKSAAEQPDGLLLHENMLFSVVPPHGGVRQYWQNFESLERWARSLPHKE